MKVGKIGKVVSMILVGAVLLGGCTAKEKANSNVDKSSTEEFVRLKYYTFGPTSACENGETEVYAKLNELIKKKINAEVDFEMIEWGNYSQKMSMIMASREEFDLMFTAPWLNKYSQNVNKGALLPLDDLLPKYAQEYYAQIPESWWNCAKVNGKIYGAINQQVFARQSFATLRNDFAEKAGFDLSQVKKFTDIEKYWDAIYSAGVDPKKYDYMGQYGITLDIIEQTLGWENIGESQTPGDIVYNDAEAKVFNQYTAPEFKEILEMFRRCNQKGYTSDDNVIADAKPQEYSAAYFAGCYKPGSTVSGFSKAYNTDVTVIPFSTPFLTTNNVIATMTGISSTSKNPERAAMLINLLNTDEEIYNTLCYGIEGRDYTKNADGSISLIDGAPYRPGNDWAYGNQFNAYQKEGNDPEAWEKQDEFNRSAEESVILGFSFDSSPVTTEVANCSAVINEYLRSFLYGVRDLDTEYNQFLEKLENAGMNKIIEEKQKQIDAYLKK